jgi:hypothetical protein
VSRARRARPAQVHAAKYRAYLDHYRALFGSDGAEAMALGTGLGGGSAFGPAPPDEPVAVLDGTDRVGAPARQQCMAVGGAALVAELGHLCHDGPPHC